jgi:hypothetical protein
MNIEEILFHFPLLTKKYTGPAKTVKASCDDEVCFEMEIK